MSSKTSDKKSEKNKKHVHIILESEMYQRFQKLKKTFNQKSDVGVLRMCIDDKYDTLDKETIEIRPVLKKQAEFLLKNNYLTNRYLILSLNDIVNDAIHMWIRTKKSEINLHNVPFRQHLVADEQKVALFFVENQYDYENGITLDDLKNNLRDISEARIKSILQNFVDNKLVTMAQMNDTETYYAPVP